MFYGSYLTAHMPEVKGLLIPTLQEVEGGLVSALEEALGKKVFAVGYISFLRPCRRRY